ncbi:MAG TPA: hypothetical protein V6D18_19405 [Thermosynechococcaceae cyanobacterium]
MTLTSTQPQSSTGLPTVAVNPKPVPGLDPQLAQLEAEAIAMRDYYETGGRW